MDHAVARTDSHGEGLPGAGGVAGFDADIPGGGDLLPFLRGGKGRPHEALYWRAGKARAVRKGKWKLVEFGEEFTGLYDLSLDVGETRDLSGERPEVLRELREAWAGWSRQMSPPAWPPRYRKLTVNGKELNWEL